MHSEWYANVFMSHFFLNFYTFLFTSLFDGALHHEFIQNFFNQVDEKLQKKDHLPSTVTLAD